jgi:hypothetical protein
MNSLLKVVVTSMAAAFFMAAAFGPHIGSVFAMHDSNLGVNTWIARDNSTQLHTIDLNKGASSPSAEDGAATASEVVDESAEEEDTATDENGDETGFDVEGEEGDEDSADGDGDGD